MNWILGTVFGIAFLYIACDSVRPYWKEFSRKEKILFVLLMPAIVILTVTILVAVFVGC